MAAQTFRNNLVPRAFPSKKMGGVGKGPVLAKKNNNKVVSFSTLFFTFTLTWITEKELERVIENKRDEFCRKKNMKTQSGCETIRNASG